MYSMICLAGCNREGSAKSVQAVLFLNTAETLLNNTLYRLSL